MIEQKIRPAFQRLFIDNVAKALSAKVKPNTITLLALLVGFFKCSVFICR